MISIVTEKSNWQNITPFLHLKKLKKPLSTGDSSQCTMARIVKTFSLKGRSKIVFFHRYYDQIDNLSAKIY